MIGSGKLKKFICIVVAVCLMGISSSGCASNDVALPLHDVVKTILSENNIKNSKITFICERSNELASLYSYEDTTISDDELKKFVDGLLLSHEKMIEVTDRNYVKSGDAIVVNYIVYHNSEIVSNAEHEPLVVGT